MDQASDADGAVDLDEARRQFEERWFVWTAAGLTVHPVARRGTSDGGQASLVFKVTRPNAWVEIAVSPDGWAEIAVRRPDATATIHATVQVEGPEAFGAVLDRVVELITWSGDATGPPRSDGPPGRQRATDWVAGYDGVPY